MVPDLRALGATAKQHLSGVADFYYKLGRHRERARLQKEETEANSHVSEEITVTWKKGGREMARNHLRRGEIKRDHAWQPHSLFAQMEQEKKDEQRHHARRYGEKLISRPDSLQRHRERRGSDPGVHGLVGEGAAQISSLFHSNLLHKSRDIGKRVSRFLCNEFAVERERRRAVKAAAVDGGGSQVNISFYKWSSLTETTKGPSERGRFQ